MFAAAIIPRPPPLLTAAARSASATQAMPPWIIGYLILSSLVIALFSNIYQSAPYASYNIAPSVIPAPKAIKSTFSPLLIQPDFIASSSVTISEAADVFP